MVEIIPAIIPESLDDLQMKVAQVSSLVSFIQIDVMDGKFVPEKSWPYNSFPDADFKAMLAEDAGLPNWEKMSYEIDLMVQNPEEAVFDWILAGASRILIHVESTPRVEELVKKIRAQYGSPKESEVSVEIGIAVGQESDLSLLHPLIPFIDVVQVMGIKDIGFQGQPFDERTFNRLSALREQYPDLILSVDGGVSDENAAELIQHGANRLISGSYIFGSENPKEAIDVLKGVA